MLILADCIDKLRRDKLTKMPTSGLPFLRSQVFEDALSKMISHLNRLASSRPLWFHISSLSRVGKTYFARRLADLVSVSKKIDSAKLDILKWEIPLFNNDCSWEDFKRYFDALNSLDRKDDRMRVLLLVMDETQLAPESTKSFLNHCRTYNRDVLSLPYDSPEPSPVTAPVRVDESSSSASSVISPLVRRSQRTLVMSPPPRSNSSSTLRSKLYILPICVNTYIDWMSPALDSMASNYDLHQYRLGALDPEAMWKHICTFMFKDDEKRRKRLEANPFCLRLCKAIGLFSWGFNTLCLQMKEYPDFEGTLGQVEAIWKQLLQDQRGSADILVPFTLEKVFWWGLAGVKVLFILSYLGSLV